MSVILKSACFDISYEQYNRSTDRRIICDERNIEKRLLRDGRGHDQRIPDAGMVTKWRVLYLSSLIAGSKSTAI